MAVVQVAIKGGVNTTRARIFVRYLVGALAGPPLGDKILNFLGVPQQQAIRPATQMNVAASRQPVVEMVEVC